MSKDKGSVHGKGKEGGATLWGIPSNPNGRPNGRQKTRCNGGQVTRDQKGREGIGDNHMLKRGEMTERLSDQETEIRWWCGRLLGTVGIKAWGGVFLRSCGTSHWGAWNDGWDWYWIEGFKGRCGGKDQPEGGRLVSGEKEKELK